MFVHGFHADTILKRATFIHLVDLKRHYTVRGIIESGVLCARDVRPISLLALSYELG